MTKFNHLLTPLKIGPKTTRSRVLVSGHQPSMTKNGLPTGQYVAYQKARARGGAGLQITGATGVHRTGAYAASHGALVNLDDSIIDGYQRISDGVHEEGGLILAQLTHAGSVISSDKPIPLCGPHPPPKRNLSEKYRTRSPKRS